MSLRFMIEYSNHLALRPVWVALLVGLSLCAFSAGQAPRGKGSGGPPPAQARYTPAREHNLRRSLLLPGTVQALTSSTVAATVPGMVIEFPGKEGLRVKQGDVLAQQRTVTMEITLEARRADLKEAEARWKLAESNLARARELFEATVISKEQLDDRQSEYSALQGRVDSLRATIRQIRDEIDRCTIRAPFNGVVVREFTEVGQWLSAGNPVVELLALDEVEIRVDVPEKYFSLLRAGSIASLTFEALPDFRGQGRVVAIIPKADEQARTFPVKVRMKNERGLIGAGMLGIVSFPLGESYTAIVVPKDAVIAQGGRKFVYRLNGDSTVEQVTVETGAASGVWLEVRGPIQPGDKVITRGNERLHPGQAVQAVPLEYARP